MHDAIVKECASKDEDEREEVAGKWICLQPELQVVNAVFLYNFVGLLDREMESKNQTLPEGSRKTCGFQSSR